MYLGCSSAHSSTVSRILNLHTGSVSPQYHIVVDDNFTTVPNAETSGVLEENQFNPDSWATIIETGYKMHLDMLETGASSRSQLPPLSDNWLTPAEQALCCQRCSAIEACACI